MFVVAVVPGVGIALIAAGVEHVTFEWTAHHAAFAFDPVLAQAVDPLLLSVGQLVAHLRPLNRKYFVTTAPKTAPSNPNQKFIHD